MKLTFSKAARAKMKDADKLTKAECDCKGHNDRPNPECHKCDGTGAYYYTTLSDEDTKAIMENFRRQGFPLFGDKGK